MKAYELKQWAYEDDWSEYFLSREKSEERMKTLAGAQGYVIQPKGAYLLAVPEGKEGFLSHSMIVDQKVINERLAGYGLYSLQELEAFPDGLVHLLIGMMVREIDIKE